MDYVAIYAIYGVSLLVTGLPLVVIVRTGTLQKHFVHFVAMSSFLVLNLVGTGFRSVVYEYHSITYHVVMLLVASSLFVSFATLELLSSRWSLLRLPYRLMPSSIPLAAVYPRYARLLLALSAGATVMLCLTVTPPLFFRVDLFGDWPALVASRIAIVFSGRFHWYSLAFFETPLFLVILVTVSLKVLRASGESGDAAPWRTLHRVVIPFALVASVLFLNKQYIVYLLAAMALVALLFDRRPRIGPLLGYSGAGLAVLVLLYVAYTGFDTRAILGLITHRTFEVYPLAAAVTFDLFPRGMAFLGGSSLLNPFGILDVPFVNIAELVYPILYGDIGFGSAPVPAVFESYANFGWTGVLASLAVIMALLAVVTLMSWSRNVLMFSLSVYWAIKLILLWQAPFWFGTLEPNLVVFTIGLLGLFGLMSWRGLSRPSVATAPG